MSHVTLNESTLALLNGVTEVVELRDPTGKVVGHYTPRISPENGAVSDRMEKLFDYEEAQRVAATERHGYSIEEVKCYLHSLESKK